MPHRLLPWLLAFAAAAAFAETDLERANRLLDEAKTLRAQAEGAFRAAEPACYERILVNRCLTKANDARLEQVQRARTLENEANRIRLAEKQRQAAEAGRIAGEGPLSPTAPAESVDIVPDARAEALRREREAQAAEKEGQAGAEQQRRDDARGQERAKAEAAAAKRAEQAARDRARYDERLRQREAEQKD